MHMENKQSGHKLVSKNEWYASNEVYNDLVSIFKSANRNLLEEDSILFEKNVSERCVCGALMLHLEKALRGTPYSSYNIDIEYNRVSVGNAKRIHKNNNNDNWGITPDLIVHGRGNYIEQDNLIALEMKKSNRGNKKKEEDKRRLITLTKARNSNSSYDGITNLEPVCGYILGIYYEICNNTDKVYCEFYRHGEKGDSFSESVGEPIQTAIQQCNKPNNIITKGE